MVWRGYEPGKPYYLGGQRVAFTQDVLRALARIDPHGRHFKAIEKGRIAPRGQANGLVPSQEPSYVLKTKVLGHGGGVRVHGWHLEDGTLLFDLITRH